MVGNATFFQDGKGGTKGEQQWFCSYCGKPAHGPPKRSIKHWATLKRRSEDFDFGCVVTCENHYPTGFDFQIKCHLVAEDERDTFAVDETSKKGHTTINSGAAESMWPVEMLPEVKTNLPQHPQLRTGVRIAFQDGEPL